MSMWGYGVFESDSALDWVNEFSQAPSRKALTAAWENVIRASYIQVDEAAAALGAAETLAAMVQKPGPGLPAELAAWAGENPLQPTIPDLTLGTGAIRAIQMIEEHSEIKELVEESGGLEEWSEVIMDLVLRLRGVADLMRDK